MALPLPSVVTWVEPKTVCPWPYPLGSARQADEELDQERGVGQAIERALDVSDCAVGRDRGQDRVVLKVVGADARPAH